MNNPMRLAVKNNEDRKTIVAILADNGYSVRIATYKKPGKTTTQTFVECWSEPGDLK